MRSRRDRILLAALAAAVIAVFAALFFNVHEVTDDTYIYLRYVRNFLAGDGLVFNPGERVEGCTGFLWLMLVALPVGLGADPMFSVKLLGGLFGAGGMVFLTLLSWRSFHGRLPWWFHVIPAALLTSYCYYAYWCAQGLESPLFVFLMLGAVYFYISEGQGGNRYRSPLFWALATMTRPEGAALFIVTLGHRLAVRRTGAGMRDCLLWALPYVFMVAPFALAKYGYYGHLLPNTYYAKSELDMIQLRQGWRFLRESLATLGVVWPAVVGLPPAALFVKGRPAGYSYLLALSAFGLVYLVAIGGDIQPFYRFFVQFAPLLFYLAYASAAALLLALTGGRVRFAAAAAAAALGCAALSVSTAAYSRDTGMSETWAEVGQWIKAHTPPDSLIAVTSAGATPYFSGRRSIDLVGLNDPYIAHHPEYTAGKSAIEKKYNSRYVLSQRPDYIIFRLSDWPRANCEIDLYNRAEFRDSYVPLNIYIRKGVYTVYKRTTGGGTPSGTGYQKSLGMRYGYDAYAAYNANDRLYLRVVEQVAALAPNQVNRYKNALFYLNTGGYADARAELDAEIRQNPEFAPAYIAMIMTCLRTGDFRKVSEMRAEFERHNSLGIPYGKVNVNTCF